ncbi:MAG: GDCCVxC domain-containing (seleno)protein [Gemmatimonadaceae bacterium]
MREIRTRSKLTCPHCTFAESLEMPVSSCVIVHTCSGCGAEIRPKAGDCCVFCSYGSAVCPPMQPGADRAGCCVPEDQA